MNVLFFTYDFPWPTNTGGKSRAYHMLKFAKKNSNIVLYSFIRPDFKDEYKKEIEKIGIKNIKLFARNKVMRVKNAKTLISGSHSIFYYLYFEKEILKELLTDIKELDIDVVHFESFYTGYYLSREIQSTGVKQIFGTENIEYLLYKQYADSKKVLKPFLTREVKKIEKEERGFIKQADATLAVTAGEEEVIKTLGAKKTFIIENGIDPDFFELKPQKKEIGKKLLFVGNFSYFPNTDAVKFFYYDVFSMMSDYTLTIIGKNVNTLPFINDPRITAIEFIKDIRDGYNNADIMVSPVRIGGGTNFKILEAMASGIPVVAHPARLSGLGVVKDKHLSVASSSREIIDAIKKINEDYSYRRKIVTEAREFVEKNFSWTAIGEKLNKVWKTT